MSAFKIAQSTELMDNYLQAEIMAPQKRLRAVDCAGGAALLFSIGTDDTGSPLNATVERFGGRSGWTRHALSGPEFGAAETAAPCKTFAVGRSKDGALRLVMVLADATGDRLYLCANASASETGWLDAPNWVALPYNDQNHKRDKIVVADLFLSDARDRMTYLVVDILRDPNAQTPKVFRYYVDTEKTADHVWTAHDISADLEAGQYATCLGRKGGQGRFQTDGLYTAGALAGLPELFYIPLANLFDPNTPPNPIGLVLPGGARADAIATCRNPDDTTDLFVAAGGALFRFAGEAQEDNAEGKEICRHALLQGVQDLFAYASGVGEVTVWGRNSALNVFCLRSQLGDWSVPVPILSGAEQITPFYNGTQSADSFFAHTGVGELVKAVKSPGTLMWTRQNIELPPPHDKTPALKFSSYTTTVQAIDAAGRPAAGLGVQISARTLTPVYINHLYYVLGPDPIEIPADGAGRLTVVEAVRSLVGAKLTFTLGSESAEVNPMQGPLDKATALDTPKKLSEARLTGSGRLLVPADATPDALQAVAQANSQLNQVHSAIKGVAIVQPLAAGRLGGQGIVQAGLAKDFVDVGDFFAMVVHRIEVGIECEIKVLKDLANDVWTVVLELAGETYRAILASAEAIAAAATWIYQKVKVLAQDLIDFLKLLFNPAALARTKKVLKATTQFILLQQLMTIHSFREEFDTFVVEIKAKIDAWAKVTDYSGLGDAANQPAGTAAATAKPHGSDGAFLAHHVQGNMDRVSGGEPDAPSGILDAILAALKAEADAIGIAFEKLEDLISEAPGLSLTSILKQLVDIVADLALDSVRTVVDLLLDTLEAIAKALIRALDTPIYIPVVSDILRELGVEEFSILDLLCWVGAFAGNAFYGAAFGKEPFPLEQHAQTVLPEANARGELAEAAGHVAVMAAAPLANSPIDRAIKQIENTFSAKTWDETTKAFFDVKAEVDTFLSLHKPPFFIAGTAAASILSLVGAVVGTIEAVSPPKNPFSKASGGLAIGAAATSFAAEYAGSYYPIESQGMLWLDRGLTAIRVVSLVSFAASSEPKNPNSIQVGKLNVASLRGVGAVFDGLLALSQLVVRGYHFSELAAVSPGYQRSLAIVYETCQVTNYLGRISYAVAVNTPEPVQSVAAVSMGVFNCISTGLLAAESGIQIAHA